MRIFIALCTCALLVNVIAAQNQTGRRTVGSPAAEPHGTIHVIYDALVRIRSLGDLVKAADVIVYGTVDSIFPGRLRHADDPASVETDALFAVDRVLKGKAEALRSVVISQMGGRYSDLEVIADGVTLLKQGDRHILFLQYDRRGVAPTYPRTDGNFYMVGGTIGNFIVVGNAVKSEGGFSNFDNNNAEDFIAQILAEVAAAQ